MKSGWKHAVVGWMGSAALVGSLQAVMPGDFTKYEAISQRNAFGLHAPPPPPEPPPPPAPAVTVKLTGITTILSSKRALLLITEAGKQPDSKMMREGDREGAIEILAIDPGAGTVKINNSGQEKVLNFKTDGIAPTAGPAAGGGAPAVAGMPGIPGQAARPGMTGAVTPMTGTSAFNPATPVRPLRTSGNTSYSGTPSYSGVPNTYGATGTAVSGSGVGAVQTPAGALQMGGSPSGQVIQPNWPPERNVSLEEQVILIEAQRLQHQKEIQAGQFPPLPPTPMSPPTPQ